MAERFFVFVQLELPWALGPADGRYLLRRAAGEHAGEHAGEPEHVLVLSTVGAQRRGLLGRRARTRKLNDGAQPASVPIARATVIDAVALPAERQARAWLSELDPEQEARRAVQALNRLLFAFRIASAAAYVREVSAEQALIIRAGFGEGEQVAHGLWSDARELLLSQRSPRRAAVLRPQERLAGLLSGKGRQALLCEELVLRARTDLDQGRPRHAAIELERAYAAALHELPGEQGLGLAERIGELRALRDDVERAAQAALGEQTACDTAEVASANHTAAIGASASRAGACNEWHEPDEAGVRHALERLEAALRARTAGGISVQ